MGKVSGAKFGKTKNEIGGGGEEMRRHYKSD